MMLRERRENTCLPTASARSTKKKAKGNLKEGKKKKKKKNNRCVPPTPLNKHTHTHTHLCSMLGAGSSRLAGSCSTTHRLSYKLFLL